MKKISKAIGQIGLMCILCAALFSFSINRGGEGFEVYLNSKLVLQQFGEKMNHVQKLDLNAASLGDQLSIRYHHCGKAGKNRIVSIRNAEGKTLKEWRFKDDNNVASRMSCSIRDIVGLKKGNGPVSLQLFYSSSELPKGRQLASLVIGASETAGR